MLQKRLNFTRSLAETVLPEMVNNWSVFSDQYGSMIDHHLEMRKLVFPNSRISTSEAVIYAETIFSVTPPYHGVEIKLDYDDTEMTEFDFWMIYTIVKLAFPGKLLNTDVNKQLIINYAFKQLDIALSKPLRWHQKDQEALKIITAAWHLGWRNQPLAGSHFSVMLSALAAANGYKGITFLEHPSVYIPIAFYEDLYRELIGDNYLDTLIRVFNRHKAEIMGMYLEKPGDADDLM